MTKETPAPSIRIFFATDVIDALKSGADELGLPTATYARAIILDHMKSGRSLELKVTGGTSTK